MQNLLNDCYNKCVEEYGERRNTQFKDASRLGAWFITTHTSNRYLDSDRIAFAHAIEQDKRFDKYIDYCNQTESYHDDEYVDEEN